MRRQAKVNLRDCNYFTTVNTVVTVLIWITFNASVLIIFTLCET